MSATINYRLLLTTATRAPEDGQLGRKTCNEMVSNKGTMNDAALRRRRTPKSDL
jgi:hypothetical protein